MPAAYSEPSGSPAPPQQTPFVRQAISRAADAIAKATAGLQKTATAVNPSDFQPDTTDQFVAQVTGLVVPAGAKLIITATFQCNVEPADSGGAANTITVKTRVGGVAVDTWVQDLKLSGISANPANNFFSVTSETAALAGGTETVDFTISTTVSLSDVTPAGKGRIVVQVVGS